MAWTAPRTWVAGEVVTAAIMNTHVRDNLNAAFNVGTYRYVHAAATAVETVVDGGWLECNGFAVSRSTYATLFALTSTAYGVGDNSTTFNLPDLQGRMPVGLASSTGHTDTKTLGNNDGKTLANRRPKHQTSNALTLPNHIHSLTVEGSAQGAGGILPLGAGLSTTQVTATLPPIGNPTSNPAIGGSIGTNNANDALDAPAYLVAGIWTIKF